MRVIGVHADREYGDAPIGYAAISSGPALRAEVHVLRRYTVDGDEFANVRVESGTGGWAAPGKELVVRWSMIRDFEPVGPAPVIVDLTPVLPAPVQVPAAPLVAYAPGLTPAYLVNLLALFSLVARLTDTGNPIDAVTRADLRTSLADRRAALALSTEASPVRINGLGYVHATSPRFTRRAA